MFVFVIVVADIQETMSKTSPDVGTWRYPMLRASELAAGSSTSPAIREPMWYLT